MGGCAHSTREVPLKKVSRGRDAGTLRTISYFGEKKKQGGHVSGLSKLCFGAETSNKNTRNKSKK